MKMTEAMKHVIAKNEDLVNRVMIEIVEEKGGKIKEKKVETDSLLGASRFMNTYKPTRGWELLEFRIRPVVGLM